MASKARQNTAFEGKSMKWLRFRALPLELLAAASYGVHARQANFNKGVLS